MEVSNLSSIYKVNNMFPQTRRAGLNGLSRDTFTPSFTGLKKHEFKGADYMAVEKFKAPIQSFKTKKEFDEWARKKAETEFFGKEFPSQDINVTAQRKAMLDDWHEYLSDENGAYSKNPSWLLIIGAALTKDLKPDTNKLPPVLNHGALAATVTEMEGILESNPKAQPNFTKIYEKKLFEIYTTLSQESNSSSANGVWVKIPSKEHDPEHFDENVDKLKALSHPAWCTKSTNAKPYLEKGDFHVYLADGKPKVGVRFVGDKIEEIQGPLNNGIIPIMYADEIQNYVSQNSYSGLEQEIDDAVQGKKEFLKIQEELKEAIENKDYIKILNHPVFSCGAKLNENGLLELEHYIPSDLGFSLSDLGVKENELFDCIEKIDGDVDLTGSEVLRFKNLKSVGGDLSLEFSRVENTGSLEKVGGHLTFSSSQTEIGQKLLSVGGEFYDSTGYYGVAELDSILLTNLISNAKTQEDFFHLMDIKFKKLEDGTYIINRYCPSEIDDFYTIKNNLGDITEEDILANVSVVQGDVDLEMSDLTSLADIKKIGGNLKISDSKVSDLGGLVYVRGNVEAQGADIGTLGELRRVDGNLNASGSKLKSLGNLRMVKGNLDISNTGVKRTRYLKEVGGDMDICGTEMSKIDKLESIGGKLIMDSYLSETLDEQLWEKGLWMNSEIRK